MDSAYHLSINGVKIGYSQGSRNAAEFDISNVIHKDEINTLRVKVYQWCDGSYIGELIRRQAIIAKSSNFESQRIKISGGYPEYFGMLPSLPSQPRATLRTFLFIPSWIRSTRMLS